MGLLYIEWKPGEQSRVRVCFIWSGNLKDNAECGSALYVTGRMEIGKREDNLEDSKKSISALYICKAARACTVIYTVESVPVWENHG